jgi:8-amino-7-oxononanoate synthase
MKRLDRELHSLKAAGRYRTLRLSHGISLSSNDYLGLSLNREIQASLVAALTEGSPHGSTGSRLLTGHHLNIDETEKRFARWQETESALYFSSGYLANLGLLTSVISEDDGVVSDVLNHASLIDAMRLIGCEKRIVEHLNLGAYEAALKALSGRRTFVIVESLYSMGGDLAPLVELTDLCQEWGAHLIVDEAHATALFGPSGQGRVCGEAVRSKVFASIHTCSKGIGLSGAFVCGSSLLKEAMINRARSFIYSTAAPPFLLSGIDTAIEIIRADDGLRKRPLILGQRLRDNLEGVVDTGNSQSQIVPLILGEDQRTVKVAESLRELGWDVYPIRPPTVPDGESRIRVVMHTGLSEEAVDDFSTDIINILKEQS